MNRNEPGLFTRLELTVEKYTPDPLVFAVFLTVIMLVLVLVFTDAGPGGAVSAWGNGLHGLLAFTMQMCLMVVTAHVLAHTGPVKRLLQAVGRLPAQRLASLPGGHIVCRYLQLGVLAPGPDCGGAHCTRSFFHCPATANLH